MKSQKSPIILEMPEKTLLSRKEVAQILGVGQSTLDRLISYSELPRTIIRKRVFVHRNDLEKYIENHRIASEGEDK